jgi:hypothetical protein
MPRRILLRGSHVLDGSPEALGVILEAPEPHVAVYTQEAPNLQALVTVVYVEPLLTELASTESAEMVLSLQHGNRLFTRDPIGSTSRPRLPTNPALRLKPIRSSWV